MKSDKTKKIDATFIFVALIRSLEIQYGVELNYVLKKKEQKGRNYEKEKIKT